jgi:hypothetical protein
VVGWALTRAPCAPNSTGSRIDSSSAATQIHRVGSWRKIAIRSAINAATLTSEAMTSA